MTRLVFRPEAQTELMDAKSWYEARSPGLGLEFARAIDVAIERALRMPFAFPCIEADFRHIITRKFPYSVIYLATAHEIVVVSCFHHRRKPGTWLGNFN